MHIKIHSESLLSCQPAHLDWLSPTSSAQKQTDRSSACSSLLFNAANYSNVHSLVLGALTASLTAARYVLTGGDTVHRWNFDMQEVVSMMSVISSNRAAELNVIDSAQNKCAGIVYKVCELSCSFSCELQQCCSCSAGSTASLGLCSDEENSVLLTRTVCTTSHCSVQPRIIDMAVLNTWNVRHRQPFVTCNTNS